MLLTMKKESEDLSEGGEPFHHSAEPYLNSPCACFRSSTHCVWIWISLLKNLSGT